MFALLLCLLLLCDRGCSRPTRLTLVNSDSVVDVLRPQYHLVPTPDGWMNDPNGPFYDPVHKLYHLFYQYLTPREWGHSVSEDMVHWRQLPIALKNDESYDHGGVFTGSVTLVDNNPVILYSVSTNNMMACATPVNRSDPDLREWKKCTFNPIIGPSNRGVDGRDPTTAWQASNGTWYFAYEAIPYGTGSYGGAIVYKTDDWTHFDLVKFLYIDNASGGWECPDFFSFNQSLLPNVTHCLKASAKGRDWIMVGGYNEQDVTFSRVSGSVGDDMWLVDHGNLYASKSFKTPDDRHVFYGWVQEQRRLPLTACATLGSCWASVQALPRTFGLVTIENSVYLQFLPIVELQSLRVGPPVLYENVVVSSGQQFWTKVKGVQLEVEIKFTTSSDTFDCGVMVLASKSELTTIGITKSSVYVDTSNASASKYMPGIRYSASNILGAASPKSVSYDIHIFVDHSILEAFFVNGTSVITSRAYPQNTDVSDGVAIYSNSGTCSFDVVRVYEVASI